MTPSRIAMIFSAVVAAAVGFWIYSTKLAKHGGKTRAEAFKEELTKPTADSLKNAIASDENTISAIDKHLNDPAMSFTQQERDDYQNMRDKASERIEKTKAQLEALESQN